MFSAIHFQDIYYVMNNTSNAFF